jgi:hypothetical protein
MTGVVDDLAVRMAAQVAAWDAADDGRAVVLDCYAVMTRSVGRSLGDGRFADPAWVARLLERFADYYFASLTDTSPVAEPWLLAHAAAVERGTSELQLLLSGVSAHINYDLVLTLVDVLEDEWPALDASGRARRQRDYDEINAVIADTVDLVQDTVLERRAPGLDVFDPLLGRLDERLAVRLLTGWRRRVWRDAVNLLDEREIERRVARVRTLEQQCARRARWILL